jgi:hypothetical protein
LYRYTKAVLSYSAATGLAELRASSSFAAGAEVFSSYEPGISRPDLFVNYGFVAAAKPPKDGGTYSAAAAVAAAAAAASGEQEQDEVGLYKC